MTELKKIAESGKKIFTSSIECWEIMRKIYPETRRAAEIEIEKCNSYIAELQEKYLS